MKTTSTTLGILETQVDFVKKAIDTAGAQVRAIDAQISNPKAGFRWRLRNHHPRFKSLAVASVAYGALARLAEARLN